MTSAAARGTERWSTGPRAEPVVVSPDGLVRPVDDEIVRQRLIDVLADRWNRSVTLIEAPGGFGKSTAISQAVRDNADDPSGIDVYVRLERSLDGELALASGLSAAIDPARTPATDIDQIVSMIAVRSPVTVCVHLDDLHTVADRPAVIAGIHALVRDLPANGRLVFAGRSIPRMPLSRLRAADQVVELGPDELAFTTAEQVELADRRGVDPADVRRFAGWPAMTRLALVAGHAAAGDFLVEEVVSGLDRIDRMALSVAALAGRLDESLLVQAGLAVSLDDLPTRVPLLDQVGPGVLRPHDIWTESVDLLIAPVDRPPLVRVVFDWHLSAGRPVAAVELALAERAWDLTSTAIMSACAASDVHLSAETCERWIAAMPADHSDAPESLFLRGTLRRLRFGPGHGDEEVSRAMVEFGARGDLRCEAIATVEVGTRAWVANDLPTLFDAMVRTERLVDAGVDEMRGMQQLGAAAVTEFGGDADEAYRIVSSIDVDSLSAEFGELTLRLSTMYAVQVGRSADAVGYADELWRRNPSERNHFGAIAARFQHGDPAPLLARWADLRTYSLDNLREEFLIALFAIFADTSLGLDPDIERLRRVAWESSRSKTLVALAEAAFELADAHAGGDTERRAATRLAVSVEQIGIDDPLVHCELRRFVAYSAVLLPEHRDRLATDLGPSLRRRLAAADALVAARRSRHVEWATLPDPPEILTMFPLVWSVELAAWSTQPSGWAADWGWALGRYLLDTVGDPARTRLRALVEAGHPAAAGAAAILAAEPAPPTLATQVALCGPMRLMVGESEVALTRRRVRQLLALLSLRGRLRRDEIVAMLWPDLPAERARNNLAVTIGYLRSALEPDRRRGEASYHLRQHGDLVWLHESDQLRVDVWEIRAFLQQARELAGECRLASAADRLARAVEAGDGAAYLDLVGIDMVASEVESFDRERRVALAELAEWHLSRSNTRAADLAAERLLREDRWNERAFDVLLGARLADGDLAGARAVADRCLRALNELNVAPSSATKMLLRRLDHRSVARMPASGGAIGG